MSIRLRLRTFLSVTFCCVAACGTESASAPSTQTVITSISPETLSAGGQAIITGSGFAAGATNDMVLIGGVRAQITNASATQLTAVVPLSLPCQPTALATISISASGGTATEAKHLVQPGVPRTLAVGQSVLAPAGEVECNELPGGGEFAVNVYSVATSAAQGASFTIGGADASGPRSAAADNHPHAVLASAQHTDALLDTRPRAIHAAMLERNALLLRNGRRAGGNRLDVRHPTSAGAARATPPAVGSLRTIALPIPSCQTPKVITARVAAVSNRAVVYADTAQGWGSRIDTVFAAMAHVFDTEIYPSDSANFADPLLTDSRTDKDGRVGLVFSAAVNSVGDQGFVSACDFFPPTAGQSSNFGEFVYAGLLPSTTGNGGQLWFRETLKVVAHETKHLGAFEWRFLNEAPSEQSWVEEGLAVLAEELWARNYVYRVPWKGNTGYAGSMFCDLHLTDSRCRGVEGLSDAVYLLYRFLDSTSVHSPLGGSTGSDDTFYDSGWSLLRWVVDRYASDESAALRALTQSRTLTGLANVAAVASQPTGDLLGKWSLAMTLDDNPAFAGNRDVDFPTWNLYDILAGMRADARVSPSLVSFFANLGPPPAIAAESAPFSLTHAGLWGGGFLPLRVTTGAGGLAIGIRGAGDAGVAAPSDLRVAIARVR